MNERADVLTLFNSQHGVAARAQLKGLGISRLTVARSAQRGSIVPVLPGVFHLAGVSLSFEGRCMAVLLYFGSRAFLSGTTAAALLGWRMMPRDRISVTIPPTLRCARLPSWVRVRRSTWRWKEDIVINPEGLRLSGPHLTLFTLASEFNDFRFRRAAEDAWHRGQIDPDSAREYLAEIRRSGRDGVKRFEEWLRFIAPIERPAASGLELELIDAIRAVGLPEPQRQHPVRLLSGETVHIDVAWPAIWYGVEPGHSWWHGGDLRVRRDYARDLACGEVGWLISRLDQALRRDPMAAARQIRNNYMNRVRLMSGAR